MFEFLFEKNSDLSKAPQHSMAKGKEIYIWQCFSPALWREEHLVIAF
jgi:hypothetical protein